MIFENRYNGPDRVERMLFDFGLAIVVALLVGAVVLVYINS